MRISSDAVPILNALKEVAGGGTPAKTRQDGLAVYDPGKGLAALSPDFQTLLQIDRETADEHGFEPASRGVIPLDIVLMAFSTGADAVGVKFARGKLVVESLRDGAKKAISRQSIDDPGFPRIFERRAGTRSKIRSIGRESFDAILRGSSLASKDFRTWVGGVRLEFRPGGVAAMSSDLERVRFDGSRDGMLLATPTISRGCALRTASGALSLMGSEDRVDATLPDDDGKDIRFQGPGWTLWSRVARDAFRESVAAEIPDEGSGTPIPRDEILGMLSWTGSLSGSVAWFPGGRIVAADQILSRGLSRGLQGPAIDGLGPGVRFKTTGLVEALKAWSGSMIRVSTRLGHSISFEAPGEGVFTTMTRDPDPEQNLANLG